MRFNYLENSSFFVEKMLNYNSVYWISPFSNEVNYDRKQFKKNTRIKKYVAGMLYKVSIDELVGNSIEEERQPDHTEKVSKELVEMLLAVAVMLASTLIPPIGIAAAAVIFVKTRKNSYPKIFYILCLICFLVNIYNCYIIMDSLFFKFGIVTIQ